MVPIGYEYNHYNHDGPLLTVLISIHPAVSPPRINQVNKKFKELSVSFRTRATIH